MSAAMVESEEEMLSVATEAAETLTPMVLPLPESSRLESVDDS